MFTSPFARDDNPPPRKRLTEIKKIGPTDQLVFVVVADRIRGFKTHWSDGATRPHIEPDESCPYCLKKAPRKWSGYLHVYDKFTQRHWFLELTEFAKQRMDVHLVDRGTLRGLIVNVQRERKTMRAPILITKIGVEITESFMLMKERDPLPTLMRVWGFPDSPGAVDGQPL